MKDCLDCGREVAGAHPDDEREYYMVWNGIWTESGLGPEDGCLCIGCLEKRLGRELTRADFTPVPLNDPERYGNFSERLLARLT